MWVVRFSDKQLEVVRAVESPYTTHLKYRVL